MARNKGVIGELEGKGTQFAIAFILLFAITFGFLALVGATPDGPDQHDTPSAKDDFAIFQTSPAPVPAPAPAANAAGTQTATASPAPARSGAAQLPERIIVKKIGLDVIVSNPTTTNVDQLDAELLKGAVRYPTSAPLGVNGTVLLFGHSSYLPIVHNQNYKAFDGIQNLKDGDVISVYSADTEYQYSVTNVKVADATSDIVELPQDGEHLTLVTCDSFATKSNRFIVTADLVGQYSRTQ